MIDVYVLSTYRTYASRPVENHGDPYRIDGVFATKEVAMQRVRSRLGVDVKWMEHGLCWTAEYIDRINDGPLLSTRLLLEVFQLREEVPSE